MSAVYKKIEVIGTSDQSLEDAIRKAIARAGETLHGMSWFEVSEIRGRIEAQQPVQFQVTVKIGFKVE